MNQNLGLLALFAFIYSLLSGRLARTPVNGPVVYALFGLIAGPVVLGVLNLTISNEGIRLVAELTLALVLFSDASNADFGVLRRSIHLPQRLLLVGLPLTIALGIGAGMLIFPDLGFFEVAILATMLAPTDAALGKAVVTNEAVPAPVREGLNVESGLNDGICVPILFTFLALATATGDESGTLLALELLAEEVGIGLAVGVGLSAAGAWGVRRSLANGWVPGTWLPVPLTALAFACFCLTQWLGGSGFIACFTGGLAFGAMARHEKHQLLAGTEAVGESFAMLTWVVFGAAVMFQHSGVLDWRAVLYAVLSLTVIRMLPVALSLVGLGLSLDTKLFLGWFGPRGLASVVFIVMVAAEKLPGTPILVGAVVATVALSILGHGLSANPLATRFGAAEEGAPEAEQPGSQKP